MIKTNEEKNKNYQIMLFYKKIGLSIEYNEDNNTFQFHQLPVCDDIAQLYAYAYLCINDVIFFFGGFGDKAASKSVHKYSIREKKWMTFQNTLPNPLFNCIAILSEEDNYIHIIGGKNNNCAILLTHMKTKVSLWDHSLLSKNEIKYIIQNWIRISEINFGWIDDFDKIIIKYSRWNKEHN
ncbi:hypothetical protein RFI_34201 [Reticulomyxa filosa]|uniref:Kelch motif family protein n=1 Tax=Reticulomyxa filosa TaxID=46433 RepID=X6LNL0_RETFI|nr:hypothetical protein RFI_34201 [Reticulomyxa filosa]|eukprot:ETO03209.1 hypothetical protein RFI_34201 [Reticulomyxa filosa]